MYPLFPLHHMDDSMEVAPKYNLETPIACLKVMGVSDAEMSQVYKAVAGVLNCGNVKFRDVLDNDKTTEVVGVLDEQADATEYAR